MQYYQSALINVAIYVLMCKLENRTHYFNKKWNINMIKEEKLS